MGIEGMMQDVTDAYMLLLLEEDDGVLFGWEAGESRAGGGGRHQERSAG